MTSLKTLVIARRPGFREGVTFRFAGQLFEAMTTEQREQFGNGEFEPEPVTEVIDMELEVPPLNFAQLKELRPQLDRISTNPDMESFRSLIEVLSFALARNYRGVPRWLIEQSIDVANMAELTQAVMDVSGLKRKEQLEEKKAMAAAKLTANSPGTASTPT